MRNKYLFIFAISIFLILSICGAGIFINDEWMVAQQLNQLSQGHQIFHNEGKYGYYTNGSIGTYMDKRSNILIYSIALPIISLPAFYLFSLLSTDFTRLFIIIIWGLCGLYSIYSIQNIINKKISTILYILFALFLCFNLYISSNFIMVGKNIPYEIIPITFTNIILFGIFSVICFKMSEILFTDNFKQIVGWIASISLTSLIFWSTTLKDHMLISIVIISICYIQFQINNNSISKNNNIVKYILSGLTLWIRPEIGIFIILCIIIYDIYYFKLNIYEIINMMIIITIGTLPFLLNNLATTGNIFVNPFLIAGTNQTSGTLVGQIISPGPTTSVPFMHFVTSDPMGWIELIFVPTSGSLGLVVPLCLFLFSIMVYIKHKPQLSINSKFLLYLGISSVIYYILYAGTYLGMDSGVIPDIRYFTASYTLFTFFALSILPYELNYRKIFKNIFIYAPVIIILTLFIISIYPPAGATFKSFRMIPHIISTVSLAIMLIVLVNDGNSKPILLEKVIPLVIASGFTWQIIMIFVYHISKAHYYPMFIPATEILYKLLFGV